MAVREARVTRKIQAAARTVCSASGAVTESGIIRNSGNTKKEKDKTEANENKSEPEREAEIAERLGAAPEVEIKCAEEEVVGFVGADTWKVCVAP